MSTLLVKNARVVVTMDAERREIAGGGLFARDGWLEEIGPTAALPDSADEVLDLTDHVVVPGLINTHHHLYQTLTRALPGAQDAGLFGWLRTLYPVWARLTPEDIRVSTQIGLAELALSGCTTAADHLYLFPNGSRLDDSIEAGAEVGLRHHAGRGSMSLGESDGGLPPDAVVEDETAILEDTERLIAAHHDAAPGSMTRIVVAPCSPFSVTADLMRAAAAQARDHGVTLHTHLAETKDEERFCVEHFGHPPVAYAEELGWTGPDVWFAHAVHPGAAGLSRMAATGTGVAHCPSSNMRLGSGIAPIAAYREAGVRVGLGVDGSASNDGSHLLGEARQAMLLARLAAAEGVVNDEERALLPARAALEMATRGGGAVLGRDDIGTLEPGKACDFAAVSLERLEFAGAHHDPVAALVLCSPVEADFTCVHGQFVVREGALQTLDLESTIRDHNAAAARIAG